MRTIWLVEFSGTRTLNTIYIFLFPLANMYASIEYQVIFGLPMFRIIDIDTERRITLYSWPVPLQ